MDVTHEGLYLLLVLGVEDGRVSVRVSVLDPGVKLNERVDQVRVSRARCKHQGGHQVVRSEERSLLS